MNDAKDMHDRPDPKAYGWFRYTSFSGRTSTSLLTSITDWEEKLCIFKPLLPFRPEVRVI